MLIEILLADIMPLVAGRLIGEAREWFDDHFYGTNDPLRTKPTWTLVEEALIKQYGSPSVFVDIATKLSALMEGTSTIEDYTTQFN
jgi:Retrotransposon gag protein